MYKIVNKQILGPDVKRLDVKAPLIAAQFQPGQFVMIITKEGGPWLAMAVAEAEPMRGIITLIIQETNPHLSQLAALTINDEIYAIIGPLGKPAEIEKWGVVVCVATGIGTAQILPVCKALKKAGNKVIGVMGAKSRKNLTLEPQMRISCSRLLIATEDGSYERRGLASELFKDVLNSEVVKVVYAAGSTEMMQEVVEATEAKNIKTIVQPNPVMSCGIGFCGSCRVRINGKTVLSCESGPLFDGHQLDFDYFRMRLAAYRQGQLDLSDAQQQDEMTRSISKFFPGLLSK